METQCSSTVNNFYYHSKSKKFSQLGDFPGGPVGKILNAGDMGSIPGQGTKIPHALHGAAKKYNKF